MLLMCVFSELIDGTGQPIGIFYPGKFYLSEIGFSLLPKENGEGHMGRFGRRRKGKGEAV